MTIASKLPPRLRKAAILISTLDTDSADKLLEQMSPENASRIRRALMELEEIHSTEQETVIREFIRGTSSSPGMEDGVELDPSLLRHLRPVPRDTTANERSDPGRFQFLHDAATDAIGRLLQREHPQVAAVVLSHLPPEKAANILVLFPPALQTAVLRRVAELDSADPEVLRDLEAELQSLLCEQLHAGGMRSTGLTAVHSILRAANIRDRSDILENLQQRDGDLATRLDRTAPQTNRSDVQAHRDSPRADASSVHRESSHQPFENSFHAAGAPAPNKKAVGQRVDVSFADVTQLSSIDLAKLFHRCDPQVTLLALTGAEESFVERLLSQLPLRDAKLLRRRMQQLGPILLRDVERAQQQLAEVAARMVCEGAIQVEAKGFAAAA